MASILSAILPSTSEQSHPHPAIAAAQVNPPTKLTNASGLLASNTESWLHAGVRGPGLLMDHEGREKIHKFDHERIPERVVHARGAGAWGTFKLHTPIPQYTKAKVLNDTKRETSVFVRFSTVLGSRGSADTVRDVRGFAIRFFTTEGNWDIVGNNIPVFFIQDGMQFPDLIHAGKPEPHNEIPQAQSAHDNFWDFSSLVPESAHMMMWQLSDYTIPRSFRHIRGFGVNTFLLINDKEEAHFVKFHWKPKVGTCSLVWDEALKLNGQDPDFHRRDLYENIELGSYPTWELGVQVLPQSREHEFTFDILDATKLWPEDKVPVLYIGEFTLNRNPAEYFAETEQIGFCTSHVVPGIGFSNDPLLNVRNFSYMDTQLTRLGGPNWNEIPINRPICPVMNNQRDGFGRQMITKSKVNYYPNRHETPQVTAPKNGGYEHYPTPVEGMVTRTKGAKWKNHFEQATLFWNSITEVEREHIVAAATFELSKVEEPEIHQRMLDRLNNVHNTFAARVAVNLGLDVPKPVGSYHSNTADGLSMQKGLYAQTLGTTKALEGRKIGIVVVDGFDSKELAMIKAVFALAGVVGMVVGPRMGSIRASDSGANVAADFTLTNCRSTFYDGLILLTHNEAGYKSLSKNGNAIHFFMECYKHQKSILSYSEGGSNFLRASCRLDVASTASVSTNTLGVITDCSNSVSSCQDVKELSSLPTSSGIKQFLDEVSRHRNWSRVTDDIPA